MMSEEQEDMLNVLDKSIADYQSSSYGQKLEHDLSAIHAQINKLIETGVYPMETVEGNPNSVRTMAMIYGARWYKWTNIEECPLCKSDLRNKVSGPPFSRRIGIYDLKKDMTTHWKCPDCDGIWSRTR